MTAAFAKFPGLFLFVFVAALQLSAAKSYAFTAIEALLCLNAIVEMPGAQRKLDLPRAKKTVDLAYKEWTKALIARARKFHPKKDANQVEEEVLDWLKKTQEQKFSPQNLPVKCGYLTDDQVDKMLAYFRNPQFLLEALKYGTGKVQYNTLVPLKGQKESLRTYVLPSHQGFVYGIARARFKKGECKNITVDSIEQGHQTVFMPDNMPPFAKPTITYKETWRVTCAGVTKDVEIMFSRDGEGVKKITAKLKSK